MKTIPIERPGAGPAPTTAHADGARQARDRAIQKMQTPTNQIIAENLASKGVQVTASNPVPVNANDVRPEDMSAIVPQTQVLQNTQSVEVPQDQTPTEEATPVKEAPKPKEEISNSQLAILARKERAIRAQLVQAKQGHEAEKQQWQSEKTKLEQRLTELEQGYFPKAQLKQEAMDAFRRGELSYDEITQEAMNPIDQRVLNTIRSLESRVAEQDKKLAGYEKSAQDVSNQQYQAALRQIETDVRNLVKSDASYEAIRFTKSERDVVDLIERTYKEDGIVMSVEEASNEVENYLVDEASKLARLEKIKKRLSPTPTVAKNAAVPGQKVDTNQNKQPQQMKTLTNQNSGSRKLSSRERAVLAFKGELKS